MTRTDRDDLAMRLGDVFAEGVRAGVALADATRDTPDDLPTDETGAVARAYEAGFRRARRLAGDVAIQIVPLDQGGDNLRRSILAMPVPAEAGRED